MSDSQENIQADQETNLVTMWFETTMGVRYEMPDMLSVHTDASLKQFFEAVGENVSVINVSGVCLLLPKRIVGKVGVGERIMWER